MDRHQELEPQSQEVRSPNCTNHQSPPINPYQAFNDRALNVLLGILVACIVMMFVCCFINCLIEPGEVLIPIHQASTGAK